MGKKYQECKKADWIYPGGIGSSDWSYSSGSKPLGVVSRAAGCVHDRSIGTGASDFNRYIVRHESGGAGK